MNFPRVGADASLVWRDEGPQARLEMPWSEVQAVTGYVLDLMVERVVVLELEHPSGHYFEIQAGWPGFEQVVEQLERALGVKVDLERIVAQKGREVLLWPTR